MARTVFLSESGHTDRETDLHEITTDQFGARVGLDDDLSLEEPRDVVDNRRHHDSDEQLGGAVDVGATWPIRLKDPGERCKDDSAG